MNRKLRHIALTALLLLAGSVVVAQNDPQYVIIRDGHYLAHSGSAIQDAAAFDPATCLWYSSNNYNYYFMDGSTRMYLKAPLALNGTISVATNPGTQMLNNNTEDYFFYDWDHGVARGIQHFGGECDTVFHSGGGTECWQVVWVSYENNQWQMSSKYKYNPTDYAASFSGVSIIEHEAITTTVEGGLTPLQGFEMNFNDVRNLSASVADYQYSTTPAYTSYVFNGGTHNYYSGSDHGTSIPGSQTSTTYPASTATYAWTITGDGAAYLTLSGANTATPTLTYGTSNNEGHKQATLTVTVTYADNSQQTSSATVLVKTPCQNPTVLTANTEVTYVGATIHWTPTAEAYKVSWKKTDASTWEFVEVGNVTSYTITGLEYSSANNEITYNYKVQATSCTTSDPAGPYPTFTTLEEPGLMVTGAIFGGGRMADVTGKTEVVIINCDSIGAIFGGNDIAGTVEGNDGSTITLGVDAGGTYASYGTTNGAVRVGSVYGGGNGYYAYNGSTFTPATSSTYTVPTGGSVTTQSQTNAWDEPVWTNEGTAETLTLPSIKKATVEVTNNYVKIDSVFGGAKNAYLYTNAGSFVTIDGGTIFAVFGGNNVGGGQGYGWHTVTVNATTTNLNPNIANTATTGYGRDFGIRYLFGGGNMVYGSTTGVYINGGQCDTVFAGGNSADVYAANITVNCAMGSGSGNTWNKVYSNAIDTYTGGVVTPKSNYGWDGINGIYNVRTLFGGNNQATFDSKLNHKVPNVVLTSGSIGTVYGGGNAGDMWGLVTDDGTGNDLVINEEIVKYGTHVKMNSSTILIDNLYGGCQVSNVRYSTWVELLDGHVGSVYGGCNVSGDVGSTRVDLDATSPSEEYQEVFGGTYVVASGGIVYKNLFAGGNGFYHCLDANGFYTTGLNYTNQNYIGLASPTHNETHVVVNTGATIKGNVYAGGNLACVGFDNQSGANPDHASFPRFVGLASVRMSGGTVNGSVYGGGNMADVFGSNEVQVSGGTIEKSLYGGNDRMGKVAQISNRILPNTYNVASDGATSLLDPKVYTYVGLTGNPSITNVYGGGNGDYEYFTSFAAAAAYTGDKETVVSCDITNQPIQRCTFVDIGIDAGTNGGHIGTVYGGGDGVTVTEFLKVFLNVNDEHASAIGYSNVGTIFGGNNKGDLSLVSDIVLLKGQVNTVYGGCNQGAMTAGSDANAPTKTIVADNGETYTDIGSYVRLLASYDPDNDASTNNSATPNVKVVDAVYGGCRMNGVTRNSLVLVEDGNHRDPNLYGGSDISGTVSGMSRVAVVGGTVGNVYGGGNGNYDYRDNGDVYTIPTSGNSAELVATGITSAPICAQSGADILGGTVGASGNGNQGSVFGGGYGAKTNTTNNVTVNMGPATATNWSGLPVVYGNIYGGSALGSVNTNASNTTTVNVLNGTLHGNVFGGGLGHAEYDTCGKVKGKVYVNISNDSQPAANCFIDLRDANIYGCNNTNGSPQESVTVNVYQTAHLYTDYPSGEQYLATYDGAEPHYSIRQVFGGGNQANYDPANTSALTTVNVIGCDNTIGRVFGGGNAADAYAVESNIDGGRFHQVFGGGNGEASAANIGDGGTTLNVSGGNILQLFGGNNHSGTISGTLSVNVTNDGSCDENITEFFGGSNLASMGSNEHPVNLVTTIACGSEPVNITTVYGGSNLADIIGDVTLNIEGGEYTTVYGGSKGQSGSSPDDQADITGKVTLNLYGGVITDAFGGSNVNGNITDTITVNVLDQGSCGLDLTNVYGASNQTPYSPTDPTITSPIVNVKHIAQAAGIRGNVFGGGNLAAVTANPQVNIGDNVAGHTATVSGNVFGGGNQAGVTNTEVNFYSGAVKTGIYGGCNVQGTVTGDIAVNIMNDLGATGVGGYDVNVFGGGLGHETHSDGNVTVTIGDGTNNPTIYGTIYGGSAMGYVNSGYDDVTKVWLRSGTVNGRLYGGGLGQKDDPVIAEVNGGVQVLVDGGTVAYAVYGCNDQNGAPLDTVNVTINGGTVANVVGGGNLAAYTAPAGKPDYPAIYITGGEVTHKVVGGGNAADITGNPVINLKGGNICTEPTGVNAGVYGGCNETGVVDGNITLNITGSNISQTTIGTMAALEAENPINVHGGGYGAGTSTTGNVTINYGIDNGGDLHCDYPKLYGDLYGGSALGDINNGAEDYTMVNILNGSFGYAEHVINSKPVQFGGNVYGGGLGRKDDPATLENEAVAAKVWGEVHVNIGAPRLNDSSDPFGKASLVHCNIYGCNNANGSPQQNVYVDVYQTAHVITDSVNYMDADRTYAIQSVFGGGNQAHFHPEDNMGYLKKAHDTIHYCENTIEQVYGGGNAADTDGTVVFVNGGRYNYIFGGGNGQVSAANIGDGSVDMSILGGYVGWYFDGCNMHGEVEGTPVTQYGCTGEDCPCDTLIVENYYFGANMATVYGGIHDKVVNCGDRFEYRKVYAGSRLATIYGDIELTIRGGIIGNLFGGCEGSIHVSADVKKYPEFNEALAESDPELYAWMSGHGGSSLTGTGGNIYLTLEGGKIGNVYGGCDYRGIVEGTIQIIVDSTQTGTCGLDIDYIYGGNNLAAYTAPANAISPLVELRNGHVNFDVFGGSLGGNPSHLYGNGLLTGNPKVIIGDTAAGQKFYVGRDVFGGGSAGKVIGDTDVILQGKTTIGGNVFGGGKQADVEGSTNVTIVPNNP